MTDIDYVLGRTLGEYERLIEQAELMRHLTMRMLLGAGVCPGMDVLDVGCGVGDVSLLASEIVGEEGSVVGVDVDREALEVAEQRRTALGRTNIIFRAGDVGSVAVEGEFDVVVGRFVLMFQKDPTAVLRHLSERLRPGAILAFHEPVTDVPGVSATRQPLLASILELLARTMERSGAHVNMGLELHSRMLEAGLEPAPAAIAEIGVRLGDPSAGPRRWALFVRSLLPRIVEYGLATESEVDVDTLEWRLREEFASAGGLMPLTWLMVAQWARTPP
jgi:ubiquinone/menaquinone biosynthesis C-methylase UbiE